MRRKLEDKRNEWTEAGVREFSKRYVAMPIKAEGKNEVK